MTSPNEEIDDMTSRRSSTPSLLECIQMRNWQKAIDVITADRKVVYEQKSHSNARRPWMPHNNNNSSSDLLAIHELCKMTTSPTSVRFSKDEISDDEEDDDDDDEEENDAAEGLDQIFDACELEEGTKLYEVTQYMIDVSHAIGPVKVTTPRDDDDETDSDDNNNNDDIERNELGGPENDDNDDDEDDESRNGHQQEQAEIDESSSHHMSGNSGYTEHESILTLVDLMGKTPLHILCENSCDSNMMRVILGSTREATGNPQAPTALSLILAKDSRGCTPLHYLAYSRQCPFSSLKLMMDYCKPRASVNEKGQQRHSRWIDPTLCTDDDGETPLHWALAGYVSSRRIKELTRHSVDAIMVENKKGEKPFDQFTANFVDSDWTDHDVCGQEVWENIQEYLRVINENQINNPCRNTTSITDSDDTDIDIDEGNSVDCKDSEWLPLHFLAGSVYDFPPIFTDLALKYCQDDLQKADANGMLPLHLACGRQTASLSNHVGSTKRNNETNNAEKGRHNNNKADSLAMKILKKFHRASLREAASTKRLPLHLAVETQKPLSLVTALIRTYPRSLNIPDPVTKLWPYVLAGIRHEDASHETENKSNESLSVSFALLRADPSVLHLVLRNNTQPIRTLTDKERSQFATTDSRYYEDKEESKMVEESYMEHSSRRIRRLTIRDD